MNDYPMNGPDCNKSDLNKSDLNNDNLDDFNSNELECVGQPRLTAVQRDVRCRLSGIGRPQQSVTEVARELRVPQYVVRAIAEKALRSIKVGQQIFGEKENELLS